MSHTAHSLGIDQLSVRERLNLVQVIWDSIAGDLEQARLTDEEQREVDQRLAAHRKNPDAAIPWEQVEAEALARLGR